MVTITANDIEKIKKGFNKSFFHDVIKFSEVYANEWDLKDLSLVEHFSMGCIFLCRSSLYGDAVLKISDASKDIFIRECNMLKEYDGRKYCKLYTWDEQNKVMLIQRLFPGARLTADTSRQARLSAFEGLFKNLHIKPQNAACYPVYSDKLRESEDYLGECSAFVFLREHLENAKDIFQSVFADYNAEMLLHGDLHGDNILSCGGGAYAAVDPQGYIGDPVFDLSRFIKMEHCNNIIAQVPQEERANRVRWIIKNLRDKLGVPEKIIKQCYYIDAVTYECWSASTGEYDIKSLQFAENIMKSGS